MHPKSLLLSISLITIFLNSSVFAVRQYDGCPPINTTCGTVAKIIYPFWDSRLPEYCGDPAFKLDCVENSSLTINIENQKYKILEISYDFQELAISKSQFPNNNQSNLCPVRKNLLSNTTLDSNHFYLTSDSQNATLFYDCISTMFGLDRPYSFSCDVSDPYGSKSTPVFNNSLSFLAINETWGDTLRERCGTEMYVPILRTAAEDLSEDKADIATVLSRGFKIKWMIDNSKCNICRKSEGRCGFDEALNQTTCFCKDGTNGPSCDGTHVNYSHTPPALNAKKKDSKTTSIIALVVGIAAFVLLMSSVLCLFLYRRHYKKNSPSLLMTHHKSYSPTSAASNLNILNGSTVFGVHVFNYRELEEATEYFNPLKELGEGGFGTVYYGKLRDGREVAIKRLYENNNKRAEQFLNEVEILANLRHQNLVTLFGCTSRQSRELLLVYEYVPNGTVADHLHGKQSKQGVLPWATRLSIATETASALVYLHDSDIVHRDIKTQNVLLDSDFSVKVADFGLSRLFPLDVTHVSTAPQGTPGYVDPEYHQCYQLTEKSDVYSFGVMLAELISSLPAVDITRKRNEINLANMAINKVQNCLEEFVDPSLDFQSDCQVMKEITAVAELAFQCLQSTKELRPSMNKVLKKLLSIQDPLGSEADSADVVDIPADDVLMLKGDMSPISPPREDSFITRYKPNASV